MNDQTPIVAHQVPESSGGEQESANYDEQPGNQAKEDTPDEPPSGQAMSSPVSGSDTEVASEEPREDFQKTGDEETNGDFYDSVESPPVLAMDPSVDMLISDEEVRLHIRLDEDARDTEAMIEQWIEDGDIY